MELLAWPMAWSWPSWRTTFMPPLRFGIYECERRRRRPCGYPQTPSRQRWWCPWWWCWWWGGKQEVGILDKCLRMGSPCGRRSFAVAALGRGSKLELGRVPGSFCLKLFAILINVHALRTAGQFGVTGAQRGGWPMNKMWAYLADDVREKVKETWAGAHPRGSSRCIYPSLAIWMSFPQCAPSPAHLYIFSLASFPSLGPPPFHLPFLLLFFLWGCFGRWWQKSKIWNWNYAALATFIVACISRCAELAGKTPKYAPN